MIIEGIDPVPAKQRNTSQSTTETASKSAIRKAILTPSRVALYVSSLEQKLGRQVDRATILPDGGIVVNISGEARPTNPADLVDMNE